MNLTSKTAKRFIDYNPATGKFKWRHMTPEDFSKGIRSPEMKARMFNARYAGREAFTAVNGCGYFGATVRGRRTVAHRVAWLIYYGGWPKGQVDHVNGDKLDNAIENLRDVTSMENSRNMSISKRNVSGVVGVRYIESRGRWAADIRVNKKLIFLGRFKCFGQAFSARRAAEERHGFHPNHGKR